ncbi:MAG TPA: ABC transporter ATP-binding protein [Candidatus Binatia bacterium]|jgi:branched-chain amino acid transport system ATP-binding protein
MAEALLQVSSLSKHFGGVAAVDDVSLDVRIGELHAVIGPNGAGKTTLINLLSGDLQPDSGSVLFKGENIARLAPDRRSKLGIGRTYQTVNIFPNFSAFENCRLAAQSRHPRPFDWRKDALSYVAVSDRAIEALSAAGLRDRMTSIAGALSHGEQRQLEIAMTLATHPKALLLDEPLAGMGLEESANMIGLIDRLSTTHAVLLVEHDMDAVFQLARVLTVMANGKILASGNPKEIRANQEVQKAYLGAVESPV